MSKYAIGTKFVSHVPVDVCEDVHWPVGTEVEISHIYAPDGVRDDPSYELASSDGNSGCFAAIDLDGEHSWFHKAEDSTHVQR